MMKVKSKCTPSAHIFRLAGSTKKWIVAVC